MKILPKHWRDYLLKKLFTWILKFDLQYRNSTYCESLNQISNIKLVASFLESYHQVKLQGLKGELGVTAQFWIKYILIWSNSLSVPICNQYNFSLKLMAWEKFLPLCYATKPLMLVTAHITKCNSYRSLTQAH